jgi:hypothetical protein
VIYYKVQYGESASVFVHFVILAFCTLFSLLPYILHVPPISLSLIHVP